MENIREINMSEELKQMELFTEDLTASTKEAAKEINEGVSRTIRNTVGGSIIHAAVAKMKATKQVEDAFTATMLKGSATEETKNNLSAHLTDEQKYKNMGVYEPYKVLKNILTEEEFRGWIKGDAIVYLMREKQKGGDKDIVKAMRMLEFLGK